MWRAMWVQRKRSSKARAWLALCKRRGKVAAAKNMCSLSPPSPHEEITRESGGDGVQRQTQRGERETKPSSATYDVNPHHLSLSLRSRRTHTRARLNFLVEDPPRRRAASGRAPISPVRYTQGTRRTRTQPPAVVM